MVKKLSLAVLLGVLGACLLFYNSQTGIVERRLWQTERIDRWNSRSDVRAPCTCLDGSLQATLSTQCTCVQDIRYPTDVFFYASCQNTASMYKESHFVNYYQIPTEFLKVALLCLLFGIAPAIIVAWPLLYFTSCCQCCTDFAHNLRVIVDGLNFLLCLVTTVMVAWSLVNSVIKMVGELNFGGWCNFILYLDWTCYEQTIVLVALLVFTATDAVAMALKTMHDACLEFAGSISAALCSFKFICCCTWCQLCSCGCFGNYLLLALCMIPAMFVFTFVFGGWVIWLALVMALTIGFFAAMVLIVAFIIGLVGFVFSHLLSLCGMRPLGLCHPFNSLQDHRAENELQEGKSQCADKLHVTFRITSMFTYSMGITMMAMAMTLVLKAVMMSLIIYYTLANANFTSIGAAADDYQLNVLLERAEMPKLFTWRWAWMFWPIVKELFKASSDFLVLAFTTPFDPSSWAWLAPLMNPFTCFWNLFTNPGWAVSTVQTDLWFVSDSFVRAVLASRIFTGVLAGLGHVLEQLGDETYYEYCEEETETDEESAN